jgi:mannose-6-phosphate isomerase-like protein (cupin superfamily)
LIGLVCIANSAPAADAESPAALVGLLGDAKLDATIESLIAQVALNQDEPLRVIEIGRNTQTSHHLVAIRGAERLHRHDRSDQTAIMLRGHGTFRYGAASKPVGEGSILHVPRKTPHAFSNESETPSVAYVIYAPPLDPLDRHMIDRD